VKGEAPGVDVQVGAANDDDNDDDDSIDLSCKEVPPPSESSSQCLNFVNIFAEKNSKKNGWQS
jgi:hypothetical protein